MDIINLRKKGINYLNFFKKGKVSKMYSICILDHPFFYSDAVNGSQIETDKLCKIIKCKTIRDRHKLALSSRNLHLNRMELNLARKFTQELILLKKKSLKIRNLKKFLYSQKKEFIKKYNIKIEYLELRNESNLKISNKIKNSKILVAYYINKIRLIDNL